MIFVKFNILNCHKVNKREYKKRYILYFTNVNLNTFLKMSEKQNKTKKNWHDDNAKMRDDLKCWKYTMYVNLWTKRFVVFFLFVWLTVRDKQTHTQQNCLIQNFATANNTNCFLKTQFNTIKTKWENKQTDKQNIIHIYISISIKYKHLVECTWILWWEIKMTIPIQFTLNLDKSLWKWMQI